MSNVIHFPPPQEREPIYDRMLVSLSMVETVIQALDMEDCEQIHLWNTLRVASDSLHKLAGEVEALEPLRAPGGEEVRS